MDRLLSRLRRAYLASRRSMEEMLVQYNATASQMDAMMVLCKQDGMEQRQLQECLGVTPSTLTSTIDSLVQNGYVERRQSPEDARVKRLFVTSKGKEIGEAIGEPLQAFYQELGKGFSPTEIALFSDWLRRLAENAGDTNEFDCG
jgi:MarR family transcriptional regulator, organic hydroperoxide resistance regulator